jgi:L-histidine Nalpha-methyltransferase
MTASTSVAYTSRSRISEHVDDDVVTGLLDAPKHLPCRLLYDARGAVLFERICLVDDYYPTRSEIALLEDSLPRLARAIGPEARVIEPGSGEGIKTRMLLSALDRPAGYVPIDVSREQLVHTARALREAFPGLDVQPSCADYTQLVALPAPTRPARRNVVFFPGSTIGNFEPEAARRFLARFGELAGPEGMLLLGADANSNVPSLLRAYDDSEGVTAEFNRNLLAHVNRTHVADFDLDAFAHRAVWVAAHHRIEMHLVSRRRQTVTVGGKPILLAEGEPIVTEHCYKHPPAVLEALLADSGWTVEQVVHDPSRRMHLWLAVWNKHDARA